jgi:glycosyltransferase involved in cell wall biosynthesis
MNILIPHGFEANYTLGFVKGLAANGVKCCVLSCDGTEARLSAAGISNVNLRGSLAEGRPVLTKLGNLLRYYGRLLLFLFRHRKGTVHFTGIFRNRLILFEGILVNLCFRLLSRRYMYTVHNVLPHSRERSRVFRWAYRRVYRIPDIMLVHTERARRQLIEQFDVPDAKIRVISIGLNEEMPLTALTRSDARARLGFGDSDRLILFFGKIDEYKGLDLLIDAFDRLDLPGARLIIAGVFRTSAYRERILAAIAAARRQADIRLHERAIPNEEVEVFFKGCDVLCLPYRNIYQSGLIFLGSRFGLPMITTDVGSLSEFVADGMGLTTKTNDAAGIREALMEFFAPSTRFRREDIMTRAQKYRWDRICRALVPLYESADDGAAAIVRPPVGTGGLEPHPSSADITADRR